MTARSRTHRTTAALALTALALTACQGDDGAGAPPSPATDVAAWCEAVLPLDQVTELFGAPARVATDELEHDDSLGRTLCVWSTLEDDPTGLASQSLVVQHHDGTVPVSSVYDPDLFGGTPEPLEVGDDGFVVVTERGVDVGVVDGDTATFAAWFALGDGSDVATGAAQRDPVIGVVADVVARAA